MPTQTCPNCHARHDVSIFVSGQRVRCSRCGIRFEVARSDVIAPARAAASGTGGGATRSVEPAANGGTEISLATEATTVRAGLAIPGFDILRTLGQGGMGEVYLAEQRSLGRRVALKVLSPELAKSADFVRRFEKEAAALAALSHPNIVSIIDRGEHGGTYYFAMEFVEGPSLRDLLREGPLAPARAVEIIAQVCSAIDYAHSRGVIHRDLKPENILIDPNGVVKVADFGLASVLGGDERLHLTRTDMAMGTFHYMAPEQRRNARDVDARADLFSLGVMLYELLTGEVPAGVFKLPSERMEGIDPKVDVIVQRAMEASPADRYQRASAIFRDLEAVAQAGTLATGRPGIAGPATLADRPKARSPKDGEAPDDPSGISMDSLVERAGTNLGRAVQVMVVGLVIAAVALFFFIGREGREVIRQGITHGIATKMGVAHAVPGAEGSAPPPAESPLDLPVKMRLDGEARVRREFDFSTDTSGEMPWYLYRGYWVHRDGALIQDVFRGGAGLDASATIPRAFLGRERYFADGFRIEASVRIDTHPGPEVPAARAAALVHDLEATLADHPPMAKLYLYRNVRHFFSLEIVAGDAAGYAVRWNLGDTRRFGSFEGGSNLPEPGGPDPVRVALWLEGGWIFASVDDQEIGRAQLGELSSENWGKAGFGCLSARCTFDDVVIEGRTRPPPSKAERSGTAITVEPVER